MKRAVGDCTCRAPGSYARPAGLCVCRACGDASEGSGWPSTTHCSAPHATSPTGGATECRSCTPGHDRPPWQTLYLNERLTRSNLARVECKKLRWRYVWIKRGRIYIRKEDRSAVHQLRSHTDLERVLGSVVTDTIGN
ncbi:hypothetical protein ACJJTC_001978 [Scirpophaga incertulas]